MTRPSAEPPPVTLRTEDGVTLAARWMQPAGRGGSETPVHRAAGTDPPPARSAPDDTAVVVVHGFGASKEHPAVEALAASLAARGHPVLVYDGRGHGQSTGECTLGDLERLDVDAAVVAALCEAPRAVVVGASMGGIAVLNHLAPGGAASGAVVVSTPALWRVPRTARGVLSIALTQTGVGRALTARRLGAAVAHRTSRGAPPVEQIAMIRHPVAVVHGNADRFIPVSAAHVLYDAAVPPRLIDVVTGMGHGYCAAATAAIGASVDWVIEQAALGVATLGGDGDVEAGPTGP